MPLTRRHFLRSTAATLAAAALPLRIRAVPAGDFPGSGPGAPKGAGLDLGFSLYGMKTVPIPTALAICAEIGYRNVELAVMPGFPTDLENLSPAATGDIRSRLDNLGLRASSLLVDMSLVADAETHAANLETIRRAAEFAHGLGQRATPVIQTVMGGRSADWDASKASMAGRLREWGTAAASAGITVAVKGHALMAADRPGRVLWLLRMAQSPAIVVAYDYSHYEFLGISLEDSLRALAPYTRFVHLKDCIRDGGPPRFLLPGEGRTDYPRYLRLLRQLGYSGPVVAQASSMVFSRPGYDPIAAAGKCYATLAPAVIAANR